MGGIIPLGICAFAAILLYMQDKTGTFIFAIIVTVINLWSFGVMHNFRNDPQSAPDFTTMVNMLSTFAGIGLLIYSFF